MRLEAMNETFTERYMLLPERYERNFLDSYGSCEQKLQTQQRWSQTTTYDAQYKK